MPVAILVGMFEVAHPSSTYHTDSPFRGAATTMARGNRGMHKYI